MTEELKPCPFCGGEDAFHTSNGHESHYACCNGCGADGPTGGTEAESAELWNRRAAAALAGTAPGATGEKL